MDALLNRERAMEIMERESIDGLIARLPVNLYYLSSCQSGFRARVGGGCALLPRDPQAPATLIVPESDDEAGTWMTQTLRYQDDARAALANALGAAGLTAGRIGCDDSRTSDWLAAGDDNRVEYCCAPDLFNEIRLIKTATEIERMKAATHINEMSLLVTAESMEAGSSPEELENMYLMIMAQQGGRGAELDCAITESGSGRVQGGVPVAMTALGHQQHYYSCFSRCAVIGEPSRDYRKQHAHMLAGWEKAQEILQPGLSYAELSEAVGDTVRRAGLKEFRNPLIRCVGLEYCDDPGTWGRHPLSVPDRMLEADMTVNIDMRYAEPGHDALRMEDTVRITTYGHERLTKTDLSIRISSNV